MKRLLFIFTMLAMPAMPMAATPLSEDDAKEVEAILVEAASKLLYIDRDCKMPVDPEKFKELAKIKAFSEGYLTLEGVSWEHVKHDAHVAYAELKKKAPLGELCDQYRKQLSENYQLLKK